MKNLSVKKRYRCCRVLSAATRFLVCYLISVLTCSAQISTDGTLGSEVNITGPAYSITDDLGQVRGTNLFHSFKEFNVNVGESATFSGAASIENIIGRVTGGLPSTINGELASTINGANVFLLNPYGVMFGPYATLNIPGSFHVSTGDSLKFEDGSVFFANPVQASVLSIAKPEAFGFLTDNPGPISIESAHIFGSSGETLSFVGGDIDVTGNYRQAQVWVDGGKVQIVSVGNAGDISLQSPSVLTDAAGETGVVTLSNAYVSSEDYSGSYPDGSVIIRGGKIEIDKTAVYTGGYSSSDASGLSLDMEAASLIQLSNGSAVETYAYEQGRCGGGRIHADTIDLTGASYIRTASYSSGWGGDLSVTGTDGVSLAGGSYISTSVSGTGDAGSLIICSNNISLNGSSRITTSTLAEGNGGYLSITGKESINLDGSSYISSIANYSGNGGDVSIKAGTMLLNNGSRCSSSSINDGNGGDLAITCYDSLILGATSFISSTAYTSDTGGDITITGNGDVDLSGSSYISTTANDTCAGGDIVIESGDMSLKDSSKLTSKTNGSGSGGNIAIHSTGTLSLSNTASIVAESWNTGKGGSVTINAGELTLNDSSKIRSVSWSAGNGGDIGIDLTGDMSLNTLSTVEALTYTGGNGGSIFIESDNGLSMKNSSTIRAYTLGQGTCGDINLDSKTLKLENDSVIRVSSSGTGAGDCGNITVKAEDSITLDGSGALNIGPEIFSITNNAAAAGEISLTTSDFVFDSGGFIFSQSAGSEHSGGLHIGADHIAVTNRSSILSYAMGTGDGADISISTNDLLISDSAMIAAESQQSGKGGDINVDAHSLEIENGASINTSTTGSGACGSIHLTIDDALYVHGLSDIEDRARIFSLTTGSSAAGDISITCGTATINDGGNITNGSKGSGLTGLISLTAGSVFMDKGMIDSSAFSGDSAGIIIHAESIEAVNESVVSASTLDTGNSGNIEIMTGSLVLDNSMIDSASRGTGNGGNITIEGGQIVMKNQANIMALSNGSGKGGDIAITADDMTIEGAADGRSTKISSGSNHEGDSGNIAVQLSGTLTLTGDASINANAYGSGVAGDMDITATRVVLNGTNDDPAKPAAISSMCGDKTTVSAHGGNIKLHDVESVLMEGNAFIAASTYGYANAGTVNVMAGSVVMNGCTMESISGGDGIAGDITIEAETVTIEGGGGVTCETTGSGQGGNLTITADILTIDGADAGLTGLFATSTGSGDAGTIELNIGKLGLYNHAEISTKATSSGKGGDIFITADEFTIDGSFSDGTTKAVDKTGVFAGSGGDGDSGSIRLEIIGNLFLANHSAISTSAEGSGKGGDIDLTAGYLSLGNGSEISAKSTGAGNGGEISIVSLSDIFSVGSKITADADQADGGNVRIISKNLMRLIDSEILASVGGGQGTQGGNLELESGFIVLERTDIAARAVQGDGGRISVLSEVFLADPSSVLDASSDMGIDGEVLIQASFSDLDGGLKPLSNEFQDAGNLLKEPCEARVKGGDYGSFIVKGRDSLPMEPGALQMSP